MDGLYSPDFFCADMLSDVLLSGKSARLYQHLLKDRQWFGEMDAYVSGDADPGLFIVYGKPMPGVSLETADAAIGDELSRLSDILLQENELQKQKNKFEAAFILSHTSILNKAIHLCRHELIDGAERLNAEPGCYQSITADMLREVAARIFEPSNCTTLYYKHN